MGHIMRSVCGLCMRKGNTHPLQTADSGMTFELITQGM